MTEMRNYGPVTIVTSKLGISDCTNRTICKNGAMTRQRLSFKVLWKMRGDWAEQNLAGSDVVSSFLGYVEEKL